jgi:hypothetical protein
MPEQFGLSPVFRGKILIGGGVGIERRESKSVGRVERVSHGTGGRRLEEKVVGGVGQGEAGGGDGSRIGRNDGDCGSGIVAWADGGGLSMKFDIGASAFALDTLDFF